MSGPHCAPRSVRAELVDALSTTGYPAELKQRLLLDVDGGQHYQRKADIESLDGVEANTGYCGFVCASLSCFHRAVLVPLGMLGLLKAHDQFLFLKPGYHSIAACGTEIGEPVSMAITNTAVTHGNVGFVVITEGRIGVLRVVSAHRYLAPGIYQWNSPAVVFCGSVDVTVPVASLGPCTLITVPEGMASVSYKNGELRVLGWERTGFPPCAGASNPLAASAAAPAAVSGGTEPTAPQLQSSRTYFLDGPNWLHSTFLSLKEQTDNLEGNDLLSRDNVEVVMQATALWRIVDPELAIRYAAEDMDKIRLKVNALVRATIARIVAGTLIGQGGAGTGASHGPRGTSMAVDGRVLGAPQQERHAAMIDGDEDLAHLMSSNSARQHMRELAAHLKSCGVECSDVYIPQRRIANDDVRQEISKQSVIAIRAEAERSAADAKAYATIAQARAESEAIGHIARAHADAGHLLGAPDQTAARLALSEITSKALSNGANVTLFSGAADHLPFLFSAPLHTPTQERIRG